MDKERIEKIRKSLNIEDGLYFGFVEDLGVWIIGGYGPVDIQEEFSDCLLSIPDYTKINEAFNPYLTTEDAAESLNVYKFKVPFWSGGRDIMLEEIYLVQCTNNGRTYFGCSNLNVLCSFVDKEKWGNNKMQEMFA